MSHDSHISWDELFAVAWRQLADDGWTQPLPPASAPAPATIMEHVRMCPDCSRELDDLIRFARALVVAGDVAPDVAAINRALSELRDARGSDARSGTAMGLGARFVEGLREIGAVLVADSLIPSAAVRGTASASPRLLVYDTDRYTISVSADRAADRCVLRGQVAPTDADDLPIRRTVSARAEASAEASDADLNEFGEFVLDALPWGEFQLTFTLGSDRVRIPPFRIDEQA